MAITEYEPTPSRPSPFPALDNAQELKLQLVGNPNKGVALPGLWNYHGGYLLANHYPPPLVEFDKVMQADEDEVSKLIDVCGIPLSYETFGQFLGVTPIEVTKMSHKKAVIVGSRVRQMALHFRQQVICNGQPPTSEMIEYFALAHFSPDPDSDLDVFVMTRPSNSARATVSRTTPGSFKEKSVSSHGTIIQTLYFPQTTHDSHPVLQWVGYHAVSLPDQVVALPTSYGGVKLLDLCGAFYSEPSTSYVPYPDQKTLSNPNLSWRSVRNSILVCAHAAVGEVGQVTGKLPVLTIDGHADKTIDQNAGASESLCELFEDCTRKFFYNSNGLSLFITHLRKNGLFGLINNSARKLNRTSTLELLANY